jgi:hypothetical protein
MNNSTDLFIKKKAQMNTEVDKIEKDYIELIPVIRRLTNNLDLFINQKLLIENMIGSMKNTKDYIYSIYNIILKEIEKEEYTKNRMQKIIEDERNYNG